LIARDGLYVSGGQQILANLMALCYMLPMSISLSTASLAAQAIGARDAILARATGRSGVLLVTLGAVATASILILAQEPIVRLYTDEARVAIVALALLQ